ncbi:hypothetical protein GCM10018773_26880 [Streptomyces candidus]|nr:hypothetical protein GCM10018773_26880 [Streptomyces candidus]
MGGESGPDQRIGLRDPEGERRIAGYVRPAVGHPPHLSPFVRRTPRAPRTPVMVASGPAGAHTGTPWPVARRRRCPADPGLDANAWDGTRAGEADVPARLLPAPCCSAAVGQRVRRLPPRALSARMGAISAR